MIFSVIWLLPMVFAAQVECFLIEVPVNDENALLSEDPRVSEQLLTEFRLYNRKHIGMGESIDPAMPHLIESTTSFDSSKRTVFYTHGYLGQRGEWWTEPMKSALLKREDLNVIYVEWRRGASFPASKAAANARLIGALIHDVIKGMIKHMNVDPEDIHCIGFDMGAHVCGFAGKMLAKENRKRLMGRITALDPAAPYFEKADTESRLDKSDATFVDVIHTDGGNPGFGMSRPVGHIDFYPNGRKAQPGCVDDEGQVQTCSHYRAIEYFINSLDKNHCLMKGFSCNSYDDFKAGLCNKCPEEGCPVLGYDSENALISGPVYMYATKTKPYCARHFVLQLFTGNKMFAGVSATVLVTLHGANGEAEKFLVPYTKYYAGGMHQVLIMSSYNLQGPVHMTLEHGAIVDSWYLHAAVLKPEGTDTVYVACYDRWLNSADNKVKLMTQAGADSYCK